MVQKNAISILTISRLMLFREITTTYCGQNATYCNVKSGGVICNH
jgi:hypothetical protein